MTTAEMALDAEGRFLALRLTLSPISARIRLSLAPMCRGSGHTMATGPYRIDSLFARVRGLYTHTLPVDAYRGAGRPEAAYVLERLVDRCARELGVSQEAIRLRNFIPPDAMPYKTETDRTYDVGDFAGALKRCVSKAGVADFDKRAEEFEEARRDPGTWRFELHRMHRMGRSGNRLAQPRKGRLSHTADRNPVDGPRA